MQEVLSLKPWIMPLGVFLVAVYIPTIATANEVMKDKCSAAVSFPTHYDGQALDKGSIVIRRTGAGWTEWSAPFTVKLGKDGHIRWLCNSTIGNFLDLGTWRIESAELALKCDDKGNCTPDVKLKFGSSARDGWTPERSRCGSRTSRVRARLGPDRQIEIECL